MTKLLSIFMALALAGAPCYQAPTVTISNEEIISQVIGSEPTKLSEEELMALETEAAIERMQEAGVMFTEAELEYMREHPVGSYGHGCVTFSEEMYAAANGKPADLSVYNHQTNVTPVKGCIFMYCHEGGGGHSVYVLDVDEETGTIWCAESNVWRANGHFYHRYTGESATADEAWSNKESGAEYVGQIEYGNTINYIEVQKYGPTDIFF